MTPAIFALFATAITLPAHAAEWTPSAQEQAVYRALSVRDPVPACAEVEALSQTPVDTLLVMVDKAEQPAWVGMRAASCLMEGHAEEVQSTLQAWVVDPGTKGLAILAMNMLDQMPLGVATAVATDALQGPLADTARPRVERAQTQQIRLLADTVAPVDATP